MTNQEILTKAIQKAIDGGWQQNLVWIHGNVKNKNEVFMRQLEIDNEHIYWAYDEYISVPELIFNHTFAKALWGERIERQATQEECSNYRGTTANAHYTENEGYQYHLQQMVIADDPIKYLGENI